MKRQKARPWLSSSKETISSAALGAKRGVAHVGHALRKIQQRLLLVIKFGRELAFFGVVHADALADELEAASDGECGGSENDGVEGFEEALAEDLAHVDRSGRKEDAFVSALEPVDVIFFVGLEEEGELLANFEAAARDAQQFFGLVGEGGEFRLQAFERVQESVVGFAILLEEGFAFVAGKGEAAIVRGESVKEGAALFADALGSAQQAGSALVRQAHHLIGVARQFLEAEIGDLLAKVIAGDIFHFVGFVEDHGGILGKDAAEIVVLQGEIGEEEVVIDDDEIGVLGALLHGGEKTLIKLGAFLAGAGVAAGVDARPQVRSRRAER